LNEDKNVIETADENELEQKFAVAEGCKITLDAKEADLKDLVSGTVVTITTKKVKGKAVAVKIEGRSPECRRRLVTLPAAISAEVLRQAQHPVESTRKRVPRLPSAIRSSFSKRRRSVMSLNPPFARQHIREGIKWAANKPPVSAKEAK
jgi:hypothetical protein